MFTRPRSRIATYLAIAGVVLSVGLQPSIASASEQESTFVEGHGKEATLTQEQTAALPEFASDNNYSVAAASEVVGRQEQFSRLVDQFSSRLSNYAGAGLEPRASAAAWISFTSRPSAVVLDQIEELPFTTEVLFNAPATAQALQSALQSEHSRIESLSGVLGATGDFDAETGSLNFSIWTSSTAAQSFADQIESRSRALTGLTVDVDVAPGALPTNEVRWGGGAPVEWLHFLLHREAEQQWGERRRADRRPLRGLDVRLHLRRRS